MEAKKIFIITPLIALIFFLGGYVVNDLFSSSKILNDNNDVKIEDKVTPTENLEDCWSLVRERLQKMGIHEIEHVSNVKGIVSEINSNEIVIDIEPLCFYDSPDLDVRIVKITDETSVYRTIEKSAEVFEQEMEEYINKLVQINETMEEEPVTPEHYTKEEINPDNIKVGYYIDITSLENIKNKKTFEATKIMLLETE